jgi:hypothetical protein
VGKSCLRVFWYVEFGCVVLINIINPFISMSPFSRKFINFSDFQFLVCSFQVYSALSQTFNLDPLITGEILEIRLFDTVKIYHPFLAPHIPRVEAPQNALKVPNQYPNPFLKYFRYGILCHGCM